MDYGSTEKQKEQYVKTAEKAGVLFLAAGIVFILVPDKTVLYKMLITNYVTPDNIGTVQNNVVDFVGRLLNNWRK